MIFDKYKRYIHYLRVSVTDRCNLRCRYCMPESGITQLQHFDILSFDEIFQSVKTAVEDFGFDKVRLTGGEPLVRKGIVELIRMLKTIGGIRDLTMTTNGILLEEFAVELKSAGLDRLNISLDTLDGQRYREITRRGDIGKVLGGIAAAKSAGFLKIKLNCVVSQHSKEKDAQQVAEFALKHNFEVRYIRQMNMKTGNFTVVEGGSGGDCLNCNRMRLSSDGNFYPCLFNDIKFSVRELGAYQALKAAIEAKPVAGENSYHNEFYRLGG